MSRAKAVFLDRDGTINDDPGYLNDPDALTLLPKVEDALARLSEAGFLLVVISNQSGLARGIIQPENLEEIHRRINLKLKEKNCQIEAFKFCNHLPDAGCECRKPGTLLILQAAEELNIDVGQSYFVGDRPSDLQAGRNAGCKGVCLVRTGLGKETEQKLAAVDADFKGDGLFEVSEWILNQSN